MSEAILNARIFKSSLFAVLTALAVASSPVAALDWSDTEIQLLRGTGFHDNGNDTNIAKTLVTLQHANGYQYGRNFFFVDAYRSNSSDENSIEVYGEYYHTLSFGKTFGLSPSPDSPIKDWGLTAGINYGRKNSTFSPNAKVLLLGPTVDFNVPGFAFFNVDVLAYHDSGTFSGFGGGYLCGEISTTYQVTPAWKRPFSIGSESFSFEGFVDFIGAHGTCARQVLTQPQLRWDVGRHFTQANRVWLGFEYQYWRNKFGIEGRRDNLMQLLLVFKL
jgi:hypothetical protein